MRTARAFTLLELVVVAATVMVLAVILLPALAKARVQASRLQCANNLRRFGDALNLYKTELGRYPLVGDRNPFALGPNWNPTMPRPSRATSLDSISDLAEALSLSGLGDPRTMYCPISLTRDPNAYRPYVRREEKTVERWREGFISYIYLAGVAEPFADEAGRATFDPARESPDRKLNRVNPRAVLAGDRAVTLPVRTASIPSSNHGREGGWFYFTGGEVQWWGWDRLSAHPTRVYTWYWPRLARVAFAAK